MSNAVARWDCCGGARPGSLTSTPRRCERLGICRVAEWIGRCAGRAQRQLQPAVAGHGRCRRAARRGLVAVAGSSALAKPLVARNRPNFGVLPRWRRLSVPPTSSAFPSGHSVSAAAFVTAVTVEFPAAGAVVAPLAAAWRTPGCTRVHWPSDVLGGLVLGSGIALVTRRWWPMRLDPPGRLTKRWAVSSCACCGCI
jgi:membrane-associated phospholipid phosphatase